MFLKYFQMLHYREWKQKLKPNVVSYLAVCSCPFFALNQKQDEFSVRRIYLKGCDEFFAALFRVWSKNFESHKRRGHYVNQVCGHGVHFLLGPKHGDG